MAYGCSNWPFFKPKWVKPPFRRHPMRSEKTLSDFGGGGCLMGEMLDPSDAQLLRDYAEHGNEAAFREIVTRHADLLYSAALRQVDSPDLAGDVAQTVFTDLARKARPLAGQLAEGASLLGWLYRSTRFASLNQLRRDRRRLTHERQAMEQLLTNSETAPDWERIRPVLDEAMASLNDEDRDALLLRFFKQQHLRAVGSALGISDDAAQKRVSRAVERLREFFAKRCVTIGASGLAVAITANAVQAAPVGLIATISTTAALVGATIAATSTATKAIAMTTIQKTIIGAALAAAIGTGIFEARQASNLRSQVRTLQQQQVPLARQLEQLTRERDDASSKRVMSATNSVIKLFNWESVESSDYKQYIANLRSVGCPEETIRDIIRADVNKLYEEKKKEARRQSPKFKYWQNRDEYTRSYGRESWMKMFKLDEERDAFLRTLGIEPDVDLMDMNTQKRANEFDLMTDFLDDEGKKAQILRLQKEFNAKATILGEGSVPKLLKEMEDDVKQILTPEEARQYDLRMSVSGNILRNQLAAFEPSEQEFLSVFDLRKAFDVQFHPVDREETTVAERAERGEAWKRLQEQIKQTLGAQRYADYELAQNQDFQQMYRVAKEAGLGVPEAKQVYAMRQQAEEQAARIRNDQSLTPEQRGQALGGIRQETEKTIHTVLGEKGWDQFNRGSNNRWLDAINPQPIPQNPAAPRP
jgi:RNA polymerase sigma factor (sigma-70 family)